MKWNWFKFAICFFSWLCGVYAMWNIMTFDEGVIGSFAVLFATVAVCFEEEKED